MPRSSRRPSGRLPPLARCLSAFSGNLYAAHDALELVLQPTENLSNAGSSWSEPPSLHGSLGVRCAFDLHHDLRRPCIALPLPSASQLALHSALISGGLTVPLHLGAFISTLHFAEQVPLHCRPLISQLAEHEPLQVPPHTARRPCLALAFAGARALALAVLAVAFTAANRRPHLRKSPRYTRHCTCRCRCLHRPRSFHRALAFALGAAFATDPPPSQVAFPSPA